MLNIGQFIASVKDDLQLEAKLAKDFEEDEDLDSTYYMDEIQGEEEEDDDAFDYDDDDKSDNEDDDNEEEEMDDELVTAVREAIEDLKQTGALPKNAPTNALKKNTAILEAYAAYKCSEDKEDFAESIMLVIEGLF